MKITLRYAAALLGTLLVANVNATEFTNNAANAPIQYMSVEKESIAYRVIGEGEPILFLNRFRGDLNSWDPLFVDNVAKQRKVIMVDYTGVGLSTGIPKDEIGLMAADIIKFLDAIGLEKTDALGWSLGTAVGLTAATQYPERFGKLVMIGTLASGGMKQAYETPDIQEFLKRASKPNPEVEDFVYILFGDTDHSKTQGIAALKRRALWKTPEDGIALIAPDKWQLQAKAIQEYRGGDTVSGINVSAPTLFIAGDRDHVAPPRIAAEWISVVKGAQLMIVPSSGHNAHGQDPDAIAAAVDRFLAS